MSKLLVADIPMSGKFMVKRIPTGEILHRYDGEGYGDIPCDVGFKEIINMHVSNGYMIMEVY